MKITGEISYTPTWWNQNYIYKWSDVQDIEAVLDA